MSSKIEDRAFDYVSSFFSPTFTNSGMSSREEFAKQCMSAIFDGDDTMEKFHPKATRILEMMALFLMGEDWCNRWIRENVFLDLCFRDEDASKMNEE